MEITPSSEISKTEYDVFLSFRGPDTRQGFTDVLYDHLKESGIQVFRDDDELAIGDTIELILEAINNSKICVPIFSKSFASSAWCLREVAKMVELNKDIVPIFYNVTPDDVKLKTSLYVDQINKEHQQGEKAQLEAEWEKALVQVGRIKGRALKDTGFVEFCNKFRAEILLKLRVKQKYTIKHLVEMPDAVEEALKLLEMESDDVHFLGMYGMGGVGKTTLAKIIFNQISTSFDSCSFLANIREVHSSKGVEYLQTKLLQDLNPKADSNNMNFQMKSVLIVLDDVGERRHIDELVGDSDLFGSRSRIIITTRDERALLMNVAEASSSGEGRLAKMSTCIRKMEVKGMIPQQAMQLFSKHAFGKDYPPEDYTSLSEDVISICGGLPLSLEVIGSLLYGTSVEEWEEKVTNLKTIPAEDVQQKLMISYNALEDNVKEIFLDIACFFIGEDKSNPIYMWKACDYAPTWSIRVLVSMSLVKITGDGKFWMHDQLRDLGREIVRIKEHNSPSSREGSRIQTYKDALFVQERNKEKEVVGLRLLGSDDRLTDFSNFERLRFLLVTGDATFHHRNFWRLSKNLSWLSLVLHKSRLTAPIKSMFSTFFRNRDSSYLMKLAVLRLSGSAITDNWEGWILIQELRGLKVLDLTGCTKLTRTSNFSKMEALEKLILGECSRLAKIDGSIGKLRKLKYLNLEECNKLKELPEEVGNLEDVEQISMSRTNVSKLPNSIGKLKNLEHLDLSFNIELEKLPECIGELRSLVYLDIRSWELKELPATIGLLAKLKHLDLSYCYCVNKLPDSIGDLTSLVSLNLNFCYAIKELPGSITRLEKLERLTLERCWELVKLPDEVGKLKSLVELDLSCTGVVVVPESIGDLASLQVINLEESKVSVLPETVAKLSLLQKLNLYECEGIDKFPELPASLSELKLNVCSLRQAPDLSKLRQLRNLSLKDNNRSGVEESFFRLATATPSRLEVLELVVTSHTYVPIEFSALTRLERLTLSGSSKLRSIPPFPSSLQHLELSGLGMKGLPDLSQLKSLQMLRLISCQELVDVPGFGTLVSLKNVNIWGCDSLRSLENIKNLTSLRYVEIDECKNFTGIQGIEDLRLPSISISGCKCKDSYIVCPLRGECA